MGKGSIAVVALVLTILVPRHGWAGNAGCQDEVNEANAEWRSKFPWGPSSKPGNNAIVEDRRGHRFLVAEYDSMHRRLNAGRTLCQRGDSEEAHRQLQVVHTWLSSER